MLCQLLHLHNFRIIVVVLISNLDNQLRSLNLQNSYMAKPHLCSLFRLSVYIIVEIILLPIIIKKKILYSVMAAKKYTLQFKLFFHILTGMLMVACVFIYLFLFMEMIIVVGAPSNCGPSQVTSCFVVIFYSFHYHLSTRKSR